MNDDVILDFLYIFCKMWYSLKNKFLEFNWYYGWMDHNGQEKKKLSKANLFDPSIRMSVRPSIRNG